MIDKPEKRSSAPKNPDYPEEKQAPGRDFGKTRFYVFFPFNPFLEALFNEILQNPKKNQPEESPCSLR